MARQMKDSGIEWIGEIPTDWNISRVKYVSQFEPSCDTSHLSDDSSITYAPMECIKNGWFVNNAAPLDSISSSLTPFQNGDIVMAKVTPCFENGNIAIMENLFSGYGLGSSELFVFRPTDIHTRYFFYWLQNPMYIQLACSTMTGTGGLKRVSPHFAKNCYIHMPSYYEQQRIAAFLDCKCAEIDAVIERTKATIEEYKKLKQAVITEAVTKGVRGSRSMKDSGIEWLGSIPNKWDCTKLKQIWISVDSGVSVNAADYPTENDTQYGVLKTSCVSKFVFLPNEHKQVDVDEYSRVTCPVKKDSLIVSRMNTPDLVGACGYVDKDYPNFFLPDRLWQISFFPEIATKYVWYYLNSQWVRAYISSLSTGTSSSMQNISKPQFGGITLAIPSFEEQQEIIAYLDEKCAELDTLIAKKTALLTELETYKKSLIYEYVTGKKEV